MGRKATHEELEQMVKGLRKEVLELKRVEKALKGNFPDFLTALQLTYLQLNKIHVNHTR